VRFLRLRPLPQACPGHHVDDLDLAAQPVHPVAMRPVQLARAQAHLRAQLDQGAPARPDLPGRGEQRIGLIVLEKVGLVGPDRGQLKPGERVHHYDRRGSLVARLKSWLIRWTAAPVVSAPMGGTSSSSPVTGRPLCRARRVSCRRFTYSRASILVIADIGQPPPLRLAVGRPKAGVLRLGRRVGRTAAATLRCQSPTLMSPSRGSRKSPRAIAASCSAPT
jgi:hypothetical protein